MKNILFLALIGVFMISCGGDTEQTMNVTGNVKGLKKGTLYLQKIQDSTLISIDSLTIEGNGNFEFKTDLESPEVFYLYLTKEDNNEINDRITFFGEPGNITINTTWDAFDTKAKIEGSETHKKLEEYRGVMSKFNKKNIEYLQYRFDPKIQKDSTSLDSVKKLSDKNILRGYLYALNFALNNRNSYISPYIALTEVSDANTKYLDSINSSLSPEVANSKYGKALKKYLEEIKKSE